MSAHIKHINLAKQVAELEARAVSAEAELDRAYERYDQAEKDRNKWHDKAQEYKQRCDEWQDTYMELVEERDLPRVITADELKPGQHFASFLPGADIPVFGGQIDLIEGMDDGGLNLIMNGQLARITPVEQCTIILLADAPETLSETWQKRGDVIVARLNGRMSFRGTPVRPQSINEGDLYDIHTARGSVITGILAARNGVHRPQSGDQYRLVHRAT